MSSPVDAVLLGALLLTSFSVMLMYRKLKRLDVYHAEYRRILTETAASLDCARETVAAFNADGRDLAFLLGRRIDLARSLLAQIDGRPDIAAASFPGSGDRPLRHQ